MWRMAGAGGAAVSLAFVAVVVALSFGRGGPAAQAAGSGPTLSFGAPSLVSGKVQVPVLASGTVTDPYVGFNLHLRFDSTVFAFSSANSTGTTIVSPFCPPPAPDVDGKGVIYACTALGGPTSATGLLATLVLTPVGTGCSRLHLFTFGGVDAGDTNSGSYTVNSVDFTVQSNLYGPDAGADQAGASCTPAGPPTATPTASNTPTPTPTPTLTATPTVTPTPASGVPDVTVSAFGVPSAVDSGGTVSFSIVASNIGDAPATGVVIDMTLPLGAVPLPSGACKAYVPGHFLCSPFNLAANDHAPGGPDQNGVIITVQGPITLTNAAISTMIHVSALNEPPANTGNNTALVVTNVTGCPDINGDNQVNVLDLNLAALSFGKSLGNPGYNPLADMNGDNTITIADLAIMGQRYLQSCKGLDTDHDGLSDFDERTVYHTDPLNPDTDGDGLPDGVEILTYGSNPFVADTDGDGYTDAEEAALGKSPSIYCVIMAADLNKDHSVNILDFNIAAPSFLKATGDPGFIAKADINKDGVVNILDFNILGQNFLQNVSQCP